MKTRIRIFIFFLIPFCASAQSDIFYSNLNSQCNFSLNSYTNKIDSNTINTFSFGPRFFGISSGSNNKISNTYLLGLKFNANIRNKLFLVAYYDYLDIDDNLTVKNHQDSLDIYYPGFGLNNKRGQFNVKYLANKFITIDIGHGKQFIGKGYQSLLLSDVSFSYPYLKLTTEFGSVRYYNLYTTFLNPRMVDYGRKKHAAIHYLDFAITKKIHVGVFESILWQSKSEQVNRGYELAYLNPIIFYRPVEFSKQSDKGNALMGASINVIFKNSILYAQFVLDDLNISQQEDADDNYQEGFFQNKYGYQLGLKGEIKGVKYLFEYNKVQPYTYGHRTILQNYSHMNQALAHPLGANFKEFVNILEINKGRWIYKMKTIFTRVGLDSLNTNYGQNIFAGDYSVGQGSGGFYGNFNGQGISTVIFSVHPEVSFKLKNFDVFGSIYCRTKKSDVLNQTLVLYSLGLRTFPFSYFQDY